MIPTKLNDQINEDPYYHTCSRAHEGNCSGRIQRHHAIIYARKQVQEKWAIVPACEYHHVGHGKNDQIFRCIAYSRATDEDFAKYPKNDWAQEKRYCDSVIQYQH
jgi:hypothetical protein